MAPSSSSLLPDDHRKGMLLALCGFAMLSAGDGIIKSIAGEWPGTAVAALRYSFGAVGLATFLLLKEGPAGFRLPMWRTQLARGFFVALATLCFFSAIFLMPLAEATAIQFTSPMLTGILSAILLKERASRRIWIATLLAFAGVLVVLRPNVALLGWAALLPLAAALGMAFLMIFNRAVSDAGSGLLMQVLVASIAAPILIMAAIIGHLSGFEPLQIDWPHWSVIARCAFVAITASSAHWIVYTATTRASAATIAPMVYVQLIVALSIGMLFYGDFPDLVSIGGSALIVAAGLWLWRQRQKKPRRDAAAMGGVPD